MHIKKILALLFFIQFNQACCASRKSNDRLQQLFFSSSELQLRSSSIKNSDQLQNQRLALLGQAVHDTQKNKKAQRLYIASLEAEINEKFDRADQLAAQGYKEVLKAQPYGILIDQRKSVASNLWDLLSHCSLEDQIVSLVKQALFKETQRDISQHKNLRHEDISLLDKIDQSYNAVVSQGVEISEQEANSLSSIHAICDQVRKFEQERMKLQKDEDLHRSELNSTQDELLLKLKKEEELEKIKRLEKKAEIRQRFEQEGKELIDKNMAAPSLFDAFDFRSVNLLNVEGAELYVGASKFLKEVGSFLKHNYTQANNYRHISGEMIRKSDDRYTKEKGFLLFFQVPEIAAMVPKNQTSSLGGQNKIILTGRTQDGDDIQCIIFPEIGYLFYQVKKYSSATSIQEVLVGVDHVSVSSQVSAAQAASSTNASVLPLTTFAKIN